MAFFTQTRHKGPGRFLQVKIYLFSIGAVLMLVGMAREIDWLVAAAIAVLAVAFVLRFFERDPDDEAGEEDFDEEAGEEDFDNDAEPEETDPSPSAADDNPASDDVREERRPVE